jgi:hypothetical protein
MAALGLLGIFSNDPWKCFRSSEANNAVASIVKPSSAGAEIAEAVARDWRGVI